MSFGTEWWQLRGWPVNFFLHIDPLVAIGTMLSTHSLYRNLIWALGVVILTILIGRFFCSWVCPFGTMHHIVGYLGNRGKKASEKITLNRYRKGQRIKYYILLLFLIMAALPIVSSVSLQTGLLDPISFAYRSVNLVFLAIGDRIFHILSVTPRFYTGAWILGLLFLLALGMNLIIPRFYCRFICPLGALFGILGRFAIWRIGKREATCRGCKACEKACEGGCEPAGEIRLSECVLCYNCLESCKFDSITYQIPKSAAGEITNPDLSRRGFLLTIAGGFIAIPMLRLSGLLANAWHHNLIRPPGSVAEEEFLKRCVKCGQCMRICPTNIIVPAGLVTGPEAVWTPVLDFRIGTSGCQLNCTACGFICPTAAIRPISLSEKLGINAFADAGPIKVGTAFVERSRCLPWQMDTPCIVCQENCPVTPKAIFVEEFYRTIRDGNYRIANIAGNEVHLEGLVLKPEKYASGDYYCALKNDTTGDIQRYRIIANTERTITVDETDSAFMAAQKGDSVQIQIHLQAPLIDIEKCIGCGTCEHECPVSGLRAIHVSAENETRSARRSLTIPRR